MELAAEIDQLDPATAVVTVTGPLRLSPDLQTVNYALQQLVAGGVTRMIVDLSDCAYVDSAGLGTLIHTFGLISERHGMFRLCAVNQRIEDLILMTHTDALLHRDQDRESALAALPELPEIPELER